MTESLLAGGAVLVLSLLLIHSLLAPAMHGAAHWLYRGRQPVRRDGRRAETAFLLLGLPPVLVGVLGVSGLLHLTEGPGIWAGVLSACHRLHEHCDVLLVGGTEALLYGGLIVGLFAWIGRAAWRALIPLVRVRRLGSAPLSGAERVKLRRARQAAAEGVPVRVVLGPAGLAVSAGLLRPLILLSRDVVGHLSETELSAVLAHEVAHAHRFDGLRTLAVHFAAALSPVRGTCHMEQAYDLDREILCDAEAVRRGTDPLALAGALVALARTQLGSEQRAAVTSVAPAILGHHDPERSLRTRIGLLLETEEGFVAGPSEARSWAALALVLGMAVAVPHGAFGAIVFVHCGVESLIHLIT